MKRIYTPEWQKEYGLDVINSYGRAYEEYGDVRIWNQPFEIIIDTTLEVMEDYLKRVFRLADLIEQSYCLWLSGFLPDYEQSILFKFLRNEKGQINRISDDVLKKGVPQIAPDMRSKLEDFLKSVGGMLPGLLPLFQRRLSWEINDDYFCKRCHHVNWGGEDYSCRMYARFGFGFVDPEYVLSRKRILFRKF